MKRGRGVRKGELCPHCEVIIRASYDAHIARCELFAPINKFVELWNSCRVTSQVANKYGVSRGKLSGFVFFLRQRTDYVLLADWYTENKGRNIKNYMTNEKPAFDNSNHCKRCTILCDGELCKFCIDEQNKRDVLSRRPALIMEAIGG